MPSFEIPDGPTTVPLISQSVKGKALRTASVSFTVTNKTDKTPSCRLKAAPQAEARAAWFEVQGETERLFAPLETQKVTVNIAVPADVTPSDFKFRLQAMNVNDPGNDYAESAVATLTVAAPTHPPSKKWPYLLVAAVLVLVVGGAGALLLWPKPSLQVPDVTSRKLTFAGAQAILEEHGFTAARVAGPATGKAPETVMSQDPAPNAKVAAAGQVKVTVDPGVAIPLGLRGAQVTDPAVGDQLAEFSPSFTALGDNGPTGVIVGFDPESGVVAKGGPLMVLIHSPGCGGPGCLEGRATMAEIRAFEARGGH